MEINLLTIGPNGSKAGGSAVVAEYDIRKRLSRTLKVLGIAWLLAFLSVFIPGLHFVLVPGFFLGGIFAAIIKYFRKREILSGAAQCPKCTNENILQKSQLNWPIAIKCSSCGENFYVQDAAVPQLIEISQA